MSIAERNIKPPSAPETSLLKKRLRYVNWFKFPELVQSDLQRYQLTVRHLLTERNSILEQEEEWLESAQAGRRELLGGLCATEKMTAKLLGLRNAIGDCLFDECHFDSASDFATALKRRSVGSIARDVLDEVEMCHEDCIKSLSTYTEQAVELVDYIAEHNKAEHSAAPNSKRQRRSSGSATKSAGLSVRLPIAVIALSEDEEKAGKAAAARYLHRYTESARPAAAAAAGEVNPSGGPASAVPPSKADTEEATAAQKGATRASRRLASREETQEHSPAEAVVIAMMKAEERVRFLENASVADVLGDASSLWEAADLAAKALARPAGDAVTTANPAAVNTPTPPPPAADQDDAAVFDALLGMTDRACAERLNQSVGAAAASSAASIAASLKSKIAKKKSGLGKASAGPVFVAAHSLLVNARGRPLLLSEASRHPDKFVGYADVRDAEKGAALASGAWDKRLDELQSQESVLYSLKSKVIAAEGVKTRLKADVDSWGAVLKEMSSTFNTVQECHDETMKYDEVESAFIRAQIMGNTDVWGGQFIESAALKNRNPFGIGAADDPLFGLKGNPSRNNNNKKSKKSKKSSSKKVNRGDFSALSIIAQLAGGVAPSAVVVDNASPQSDNDAVGDAIDGDRLPLSEVSNMEHPDNQTVDIETSRIIGNSKKPQMENGASHNGTHGFDESEVETKLAPQSTNGNTKTSRTTRRSS